LQRGLISSRFEHGHGAIRVDSPSTPIVVVASLSHSSTSTSVSSASGRVRCAPSFGRLFPPHCYSALGSGALYTQGSLRRTLWLANKQLQAPSLFSLSSISPRCTPAHRDESAKVASLCSSLNGAREKEEEEEEGERNLSISGVLILVFYGVSFFLLNPREFSHGSSAGSWL